MRKRHLVTIVVCWGLFLLFVIGCGTPLGSAQAQFAGSKADKPAPAPARQKAKEVPLADRLHSPVDAERPLADKIRSPRETLKTLYFAVLLYDLFPQMIEDAIACLDLDALQPRPRGEDAAMLALDLEYVLESLALPISGVPDETVGHYCVLQDAEGFTLAMLRSPDGGCAIPPEWRAPIPSRCPAASGSAR